MSDPIRIRPAGPADAERIAGYNQAMARETEERELSVSSLVRGVAAVFADRQKGLYLIAEEDDQPVGSLLLTTEWSDWRDGVFWWIQSVYVEPDHRRGGVYRALHGEVVRMARETEGVCGVRLYVERENVVARKVYEAMGMEETSYRLYEEDFTPVSPAPPAAS